MQNLVSFWFICGMFNRAYFMIIVCAVHSARFWFESLEFVFSLKDIIIEVLKVINSYVCLRTSGVVLTNFTAVRVLKGFLELLDLVVSII